MDIRTLQHKAHNMALRKGWWPYPTDAKGQLRLTPENIATKLFRVMNEVSEAGEELAAGNLNTYWMHAGVRYDDPAQRVHRAKPEGLPIELADVAIRLLDLAGALGVDLQGAIETKLAFNETRKHRHGGKTI